MKSAKASCAECPSSEMLSSWYDRELRDCRIDEHVATCDECRRVIAAYHSLDNMLSSNLGMGGRSEVIIRSVLDQSKRPLLLRFPVYKLSLVAGLAIIATTLVVTINKLPENGVAANAYHSVLSDRSGIVHGQIARSYRYRSQDQIVRVIYRHVIRTTIAQANFSGKVIRLIEREIGFVPQRSVLEEEA
mgnify:CR=1 FL=1